MVFSSFLMNNLHDITAFRVCYSIGLTSYTLLICFPESDLITYLANVMLITSIAGWFNTQLLILEMRVPASNVGSVAALTRTLGVGAAVAAPTVANLQAPGPYFTLMILASCGFLLTFLLPPPGLYLPSAQKTGDTSAVLIDKQSNAPTLPYMNMTNNQDAHSNLNVPMTNFALHQSSFQDTYTERSLNVSRPQLNDTRLDPDIYLMD